MRLEDVERREVFEQTCGDIMVYPLYRHTGIGNGVTLLVFHNAPDATMYLHKKGGGISYNQLEVLLFTFGYHSKIFSSLLSFLQLCEP